MLGYTLCVYETLLALTLHVYFWGFGWLYSTTVPCVVEFTGHLLSDEILLAERECERGNGNNQWEWKVMGLKKTFLPICSSVVKSRLGLILYNWTLIVHPVQSPLRHLFWNSDNVSFKFFMDWRPAAVDTAKQVSWSKKDWQRTGRRGEMRYANLLNRRWRLMKKVVYVACHFSVKNK